MQTERWIEARTTEWQIIGVFKLLRPVASRQGVACDHNSRAYSIIGFNPNAPWSSHWFTPAFMPLWRRVRGSVFKPCNAGQRATRQDSASQCDDDSHTHGGPRGFGGGKR